MRKTFLCSYLFDGDEWGFEIKADDRQEARARLLAIRDTGRVDGELKAVLPATGVPRAVPSAIVAFLNRFRRHP